MTLTDDILARAMQMPAARVQRWTQPLNAAMAEFGITTGRQVAYFLAQLGHESVSLTRVEENLSYSTAERVVAVFRRFDLNGNRKIEPEELAHAKGFLNNPQKLANFVYAGRGGNGNDASGDGWRYRGRSPIQITLKDGYARMGVLLGLPLLHNPDLLLDPVNGARAAAAYWKDNGLNRWADAGDVLALSRAINLGNPRSKAKPEGLEDRIARTNRALALLGAA